MRKGNSSTGLLFLLFLIGLFYFGNSYPWTAALLFFIVILLIASISIFISYKNEQKIRVLDLSQIDFMDGWSFEHYVSKVLDHHGFNTMVTKGSNDMGVDIIAKKDNIKYAVQVKRQNRAVSRKAISDAIGGTTKYGCNGIMVVTNNYFSKSAKELAEYWKKIINVILIDRDNLTDMINDFHSISNHGGFTFKKFLTHYLFYH